jgi:hypothetical protein
MNPLPIHITRHAMERFKDRWPHPTPPPCWETAMKALLDAAAEEDIGFGVAVRLINNGLRPARYFVFDGWRFVTDEATTRLLTCERIIFKGKPPRKWLTPKERRHKRRQDR